MPHFSKKEAIQILREQGIYTTKDLGVAIAVAAAKGDLHTLRLLIAARANVNYEAKGYTPLFFAVDGGHEECVKLLLKERTINANWVDEKGNSALIWAVMNNRIECLRVLLSSKKVDVNLGDKYGFTALHWAVQNSETSALKLLITHPELDVNRGDEEGYTAMHNALNKGYGRPEYVRLLLSNPNIDIFKRTKDSGVTVFDCAIFFNHPECLQLLLNYTGKRIEKCRDYFYRLLEYAKKQRKRKCAGIIETYLANFQISATKEEDSISKHTQIPLEPIVQNEDIMCELNQLVGLAAVKQEVASLIHMYSLMQKRRARGMKTGVLSNHLVFSGNPGTGKTSVARLLAKIYHRIGIIEYDKVIEVDRSCLVGQYVGSTAIKVAKVVEEAMGGILFIDEAYTLSRGNGKFGIVNDFGLEAIDTLLKAMEDYRDKFIVIVAGYSDLMKEFIDSNPGLASRFNTYIHFEDYTADELMQIFLSLCNKEGYVLTKKAWAIAQNMLKDIYEHRTKNFANGRDVRNIFEKVIRKQATRLYKLPNPTDQQLVELLEEDFDIN